MPTETHPDGSIRSVVFDQIAADDGLTLEGYAAVFDSPTRISNMWEGDFTETIRRGAFTRAVRANPKPVIWLSSPTRRDGIINGLAAAKFRPIFTAMTSACTRKLISRFA